MTSPLKSKQRPYDIIVWGASGFTGTLVVEYLAERYPPDKSVRWALAGRNEARLTRTLNQVSFSGSAPDIVLADSHDRASLDRMTGSTRVVLTTVGPYAKYGDDLVASCVTNGTDYCDLCGEVQWMRRVIDQQQQSAVSTGARIVMSCGFDSIPSDIGMQYLQEIAVNGHGHYCDEINLFVRALKGGASGGTFASMLNAIDQARTDKRIARTLADPYALNPDGERNGPDQRDQTGSRFDPATGFWTAPFVMASVNTRVVRRSHALLGYPYGKNFRYREAFVAGTGIRGRLKSLVTSLGLKLFLLLSAVPFTRRLIILRMIPKPGDGPSREQRTSGFFNLLLVGRLPGGKTIKLRVEGDRDPGYGSTSKMLAESAICLAKDELDTGGGCWTPASAMGERLRTRLVENAGLGFDPE